MKKQNITYFLVKVSEAKTEYLISFSIGEKVKVIDGKKQPFYGTIQLMKKNRDCLSQFLFFFDRKYPLYINFSQVNPSLINDQ